MGKKIVVKVDVGDTVPLSLYTAEKHQARNISIKLRELRQEKDDMNEVINELQETVQASITSTHFKFPKSPSSFRMTERDLLNAIQGKNYAFNGKPPERICELFDYLKTIVKESV